MDKGGNRTIWLSIGGLALALIIGAAVAGGGKSKSTPLPPPPLDDARAVLIAGADNTDRTLLVPPCNGPPGSARRNLAAGRPTSNSVVLRVPASLSARVVLVPDCVKGTSDEAPAAAFVLPVGSQSPRSGALKLVAQTQVLVPRGSRAKTLIVPPCAGDVPKQDTILSPEAPTPVVTAPRC